MLLYGTAARLQLLLWFAKGWDRVLRHLEVAEARRSGYTRLRQTEFAENKVIRVRTLDYLFLSFFVGWSPHWSNADLSAGSKRYNRRAQPLGTSIASYRCTVVPNSTWATHLPKNIFPKYTKKYTKIHQKRFFSGDLGHRNTTKPHQNDQYCW